MEFSFYNNAEGVSVLHVVAFVTNPSVPDDTNRTAAEANWHTFAQQLGHNIATHPDGRAVRASTATAVR